MMLNISPDKISSIILVEDYNKDHCKEFCSKLSALGHEVSPKFMENNLISKVIYTVLSSVPYFMKNVTKVFVGAVTMFANGTLLNMAGTAMVS